MNGFSTADRALMDALFREKVRRARERPMAQKILDGARLFDENSRLM